MKISKLLVLGALLLTGNSAMAAIVERQMPVPTTQGFVVSADTTQNYYLYNVEAKMFFTEGNSWGTQASVGTNGLKVAFTVAEEGVYFLNDYSVSKKSWKLTFFDSATAMFVDRGSQANYGWAVVENGATFRLHAADGTYNPDLNAATYPDQYVGLDVTENVGNTALSPFLTEGEGHYITWAFVTSDNMAVWSAAVAVYEKAQELKAVIEDARALGLDVTAYEAVYNNADATIEQIEAAIEAAKSAINNQAANGATVSNPKDMTVAIANPNFDDASYAGWQGTAPNMTGSGAHGPANVAEHYNKTYETYQELAGMPAGVYMLENNGFYRGSFDDSRNKTNRNGMLFAIADGDTLQTAMANPWDIRNTIPYATEATEWGVAATESYTSYEGVTYYAPNDPSAARVYFENGYYKNKVFFSVAGGNVKLGVRKTVAVTNDWTTFDSFKLTFFGNEGEAYQYWLNNIDKEDYNGVASPMYVQAYENAFNTSVSNKAGVLAALAAAEAALVPLNRNVELWAEYKALVAKLEALVTEDKIADLAVKEDIGEYIDFTADGILKNFDSSNEELEDAIAEANEWLEAANSAVADGTDVTGMYLKNANFDSGSANWTVGKGSVAFRENIAEAYGTDFDVYQEVTGAAVGVYEVQVQGFFRMNRDAAAYDQYLNGDQKTDAGVYINDNKTNLKCIFDEGLPQGTEENEAKTGGWMADLGTGFDYPNDMTSASYIFGLQNADGSYKYYNNSAFGLVAEAGDVLRIGVKGNVTGANWICFDNIRLIKRGYTVEVVKPVLEAKIAEVEQVLTEMTTKTAKANLTAALADANEKVAGTDGLKMFQSLAALIKAVNAANEGHELCVTLNDLNNELLAAIDANSGSSAVDEAGVLYETVSVGLANSDFDESDIEAYTLKVREMLLKLRLPADYANASDSNTKDLTAFIQTPDFEKTVNGAKTNAIDGWQGTTGYNFGNNDTQKAALALEFYEKTFDMYQDVAGVGEVVLPNGTYEVMVNAFERVADATPAYLYVQSGSSAEVELMKLADGVDEEAGESAPNDMVSAVQMFEEGRYLNKLVVNVTDNKLRIGIKHEANSGADWIIMDNFRLIYHGTDSSLELGIETLENDVKQAVKVEYFTVDGRKAAAAQTGLVIKKMTMNDGTIVVKKITK